MLHDPTFWVMVGFLVFVAVILYVKLPGKIGALLDARAGRIKSDLERAASLRSEAEALLIQYQAKQREAMTEAAEMVARARIEAEAFSKQSAIDLENQIARRRQQAETKIAQAEAQAIADVRRAVADLATEAARKILSVELKGAPADRLVDQAISQIPSKLN